MKFSIRFFGFRLFSVLANYHFEDCTVNIIHKSDPDTEPENYRITGRIFFGAFSFGF